MHPVSSAHCRTNSQGSYQAGFQTVLQDRQPMTNHASTGTLVISVDLEAVELEKRPAGEEATLATIDSLLAILRDARMAATWGSSRPATCAAVQDVLAEAVGHEVALRTIPQRPGDVAIRRTRELAQQVQLAERNGHPITTLLVDEVPHAEMLANLCRLGITAVSVASTSYGSGTTDWLRRMTRLFAGSNEEPPQSRLLRFGLWEVAAAIDLLARPAAACRALEMAAACGDVLHVNLQAPRLHQGRAGGLRRVEALAHAAFELRNERRLEIATIAGLASRLRAQRTCTPAQSILRRAA
jgi:hypothetical protein